MDVVTQVYLLPILYTIIYFFLALLVSLLIDSIFPDDTREQAALLPVWYLMFICLLQLVLMVVGFMFVVQAAYLIMYVSGVDTSDTKGLHVISASVFVITTIFIACQRSFIVRLTELTSRLRGK
jgi:heme/copper-type cytochrome/quinol oxidase subunit 2